MEKNLLHRGIYLCRHEIHRCLYQILQINRPFEESLFVVFGTDSGVFHVYKGKYRGVRGFSPHVIMFDGVQNETHKEIMVMCGIVGCGCKLYESQLTEYPYDVEIKHVRKHDMLHADFEALINFKDDSYKIN